MSTCGPHKLFWAPIHQARFTSSWRESLGGFLFQKVFNWNALSLQIPRKKQQRCFRRFFTHSTITWRFFFSQSHRIRSSSIDFYYISLAIYSSIELVINAISHFSDFEGKNTKLGCIVNNHQLNK